MPNPTLFLITPFCFVAHTCDYDSNARIICRSDLSLPLSNFTVGFSDLSLCLSVSGQTTTYIDLAVSRFSFSALCLFLVATLDSCGCLLNCFVGAFVHIFI